MPLDTPRETVAMTPVGVIHSPYKEKFAVPRQPGLVEDGIGELQLLPPFNQLDAVRGLEQFSHLWLIFVFHQTQDQGWRPTVRPPRLGGNERIGVFATRSTFRPNPIGLSKVAYHGTVCRNGEIFLKLGSLDLVDGTPILDIKPYLPYVDSQPDASAGFAQQAPEPQMPIRFNAAAESVLHAQQNKLPTLRRFISEVLAQDPRPAYRKQQADDRHYAVHLLDFNVRWVVHESEAEVIAIEKRS